MLTDPDLIEKLRQNIWKWLLGTISSVTTIIGFVNLLRGNHYLGIVILATLLAGNALLFLLYIAFHTVPSPLAEDRRIYPYERYRTLSFVGIGLVSGLVILTLITATGRRVVKYAFVGTPTATATATPTASATPLPTQTLTPAPPEVTMLVTVEEGYACDVYMDTGSVDANQRSTLDVGINNNSDRDIMITSVSVEPDWIYASQWMGPVPVSATYTVSVDEWWDEYQRLLGEVVYPDPTAPTPEPELVARVKQDGDTVWVRPDPIEVEEIAGDKYTIGQHSQERFEVSLGLAEKYKFLLGTVTLKIHTDSNVTLESEPIEIAVCYLPVESGSNPPALTPTALTGIPEATRQASTGYAWNDLAEQENGQVSIQISRVVLADTPDGLDFYPESIPEDFDVFGEIIYTISNNYPSDASVFPGLGGMSFTTTGGYNSPSIIGDFGDPIDGLVSSGETKIGGIWLGLTDVSLSEISELYFFIGCPVGSSFNCIGDDYRIRVYLSNQVNDPIPEELRQFLQP
jgi:hypothetical protein